MAVALRLDFERDGVVGSPDEVRDLYQQACDLGYSMACNSDQWHDADGLPDLQKAAKLFTGQCSRTDPAACLVDGWAIEAEPIDPKLTGDDKVDAQVDLLVRAQRQFRSGCGSWHPAPCFELARYSWERAALGDETPKEQNVREAAARRLLTGQCRDDYLPACVALGDLLPQLPEKIDSRGSAGNLYKKACDAGYAQGCYRLGVLVAPQLSETENRHWFEALCERGHSGSCLWVARSMSEAAGSDVEALEAWKRACLFHAPEGCRRAGPLLVADRPAEALQVFRLGCAFKDNAACGQLGLLLIKQDQGKAAIAHLDTGCEAGVVDACVEVGLLRLEGRQTDADPVRARVDLMKGCPDEGSRNIKACHALGRIYEDGFGTERDRSVAARYYRSACAAGQVQSCYRVGESVMALNRVAQTDQLLTWAQQGYVQACDAGVPQACLPATELFASGPAAIRDPSEADRRFNELCSDQGEGLACRRYGQWVLSRAQEDEDLAAARDIFSKGMDLGDTESTRQLAKMFWYGQGGPRRRGKANKLFRKACKAGNGLACGGASQPDFVRP
jgi:TPR repeat protein